jgi:hypothetical protein
MTRMSKEIKLAVANEIVYKLWAKGLISDKEKDIIIEKNKQKILS